RRDPDRAREAVLLADRRLDLAGEFVGASEATAAPDADVEVSFLDPGGLKAVREGAEGVHDLAADSAVQLEVRRHEHGLGTPSRGLDARHRRSDAEPAGFVARGQDDPPAMLRSPRSEEHTSELQSRGHLVCRLLLEKKL